MLNKQKMFLFFDNLSCLHAPYAKNLKKAKVMEFATVTDGICL